MAVRNDDGYSSSSGSGNGGENADQGDRNDLRGSGLRFTAMPELYTNGGDVPPGCCNGLSNLVAAAKTTDDRRTPATASSHWLQSLK
ncbi:hypothetical protein MA16_Dca026205 [Dendrobium catenatum]|uniref:Uncharacterized protein n=1 Tax=Dendrobium catenatum TaxID=906689 RepID=A0A2I0VE59_9ASPA|nr:hypothetical protein MA16_Dca026205 [Dendrobium catenatum]